jgi:hypothetical protein
VAEIVFQRVIEPALRLAERVWKRKRNHKMRKDDLAADIEKMSLSELAALEADVVREVTAGTIAPREADTIPDGAEERRRALKREVSSH